MYGLSTSSEQAQRLAILVVLLNLVRKNQSSRKKICEGIALLFAIRIARTLPEDFSAKCKGILRECAWQEESKM
jgi:hypothetical protein